LHRALFIFGAIDLNQALHILYSKSAAALPLHGPGKTLIAPKAGPAPAARQRQRSRKIVLRIA